jgi:hypothetical protein
MSKRKLIWLGLAALIVVIWMYGARAEQGSEGGSSGGGMVTAADTATFVTTACQRLLKEKLTAPETAEIEPFSMKRHADTHSFVGAGQATSANPAGVKVTHDFVCVVGVDVNKVNVVLRSQNRAMYDEMIKVFDL